MNSMAERLNVLINSTVMQDFIEKCSREYANLVESILPEFMPNGPDGHLLEIRNTVQSDIDHFFVDGVLVGSVIPLVGGDPHGSVIKYEFVKA